MDLAAERAHKYLLEMMVQLSIDLVIQVEVLAKQFVAHLFDRKIDHQSNSKMFAMLHVNL